MRDDQTDQPIEPSRYSFMNARTSPCVKTQNHMVLVNGWRDDDVARVINVEPASESGKYGGVGTRCDNARPQLGKDLFEQDRLMPIAVIGLALRFPQDATTPELFWQMLLDKQSAMTEMPADRFNFNAFHQPGEHQNGGLNVKGAHFLKEDIGRFDAPFFSMTSAEAECVDPQQRLLLEVAYEAFENAGISIQQARASNTSVYVGSFNHDYETMLSRDPEVQAKYKTTGTESGMLANRLSWFYDLRGPSVSVDTACSSSLVALNLACQSIYSGEATMSLVGGCNLFFNPDILASMTDLGLLSPDGKSYSFDNRANGYSRGEGFAVVLIKPLEAALHDGDTIRAVIRATSMNQDGRTPGITQPNGDAQRALINQTYAKGGLDMRHTRFFEAHGTGTPLGDPIEARAINAAFGSYRSKEEPLYVGAVKANIGHLEGASGLAGLVKTVLALEKGLIPPNALFEKPNTSIPFHEWNIQVLTYFS